MLIMLTDIHEKSELTTAQRYVDKLVKEYIDKHTAIREFDELIEENNLEKRDIKGYHGREILELLQNADDAYEKSIEDGNSPSEELNIDISYEKNVLRISNTGTTFDSDGIKAIVQGNNSPKSGRYIGNKGTGFRSILNWANAIRIYSGDFNVEFSESYAQEIFENIKSNDQIKKQLLRRSDLHIPILSVPRNISGRAPQNKTIIEITVNPDKILDDYSVQNQIDNLDMRMLLFLPNTNSISINANNQKIVFYREITSQNKPLQTVHLYKSIDGTVVAQESFFVKRTDRKLSRKKHGDRESYECQLAIAVPENIDEFKEGHLYSYFPLLLTDAPFRCIMHATYELGDQRNTLNSSELNGMIVQEQLDFLIEIANDLLAQDQSALVRKLLIPINFTDKNWKFSSGFRDFQKEEHYLEMVQYVKMYETSNGEMISAADNPEILSDDYPSIFVGNQFGKLLKPIGSPMDIMLLQALEARREYRMEIQENDLLCRINFLSAGWSIEEQIQVFIWWDAHYETSLPQLLKTQTGEWLAFQEHCYFVTGESMASEVPGWVQTPSLQFDYQDQLFIAAKTSEKVKRILKEDKRDGVNRHISRLICQAKVYRNVKFSYTDKNRIIEIVNGSVTDYDKACEFVKWLWDNYRTKKDWTLPSRLENGTERIHYHFPTEQHSIADSDFVYIGEAYGNNLAKKLFDDTFLAFPAPSVFGIDENQYDEFFEFIKKFNLAIFPSIIKQDISNPIPAFNDIITEQIVKQNGYDKSRNCHVRTLSLSWIKNLDHLLENLSTEEVIEWVCSDEKLKNHLHKKIIPLEAGETVKYSATYLPVKVCQGSYPNYILYVFNHSKWIKIGDKYYAPVEILISDDYQSNREFKELLPLIDDEWISNLSESSSVDYEEVNNILGLFKFCHSVTDLESQKFYELMLRLPEYDSQKSLKLSHHIYRALYSLKESVGFAESENKRRFFNEGLVLASYQNRRVFHKAKDTYVPSSKIVVKKDEYILDINDRQSSGIFMQVFGCKKYNKEWVVVPESIVLSQANQEFQVYFSKFKKYAHAYGELNYNLRNTMDRLEVSLVKAIEVTTKGQKISVDSEYRPIRQTVTKWYITIFDDCYDNRKVSECIEIIYANIARTPGFDGSKLGELFRAENESAWQFLINKEVGSLDGIATESYGDIIKRDFLETVKKVDPNYDLAQIQLDYEDFSCIENAPMLIKILNDLALDVDTFIQIGFKHSINLIPFYRKKLSEFIRAQTDNYRDYLFNKALSDPTLQDNFLKTLQDFENFDIPEHETPETRNSVGFSIEHIVETVFGNWRYLNEERPQLARACEIYSLNYESMNPENLFAEEIANNTKVQQMIYFGKNEQFQLWLQKQQDHDKKRFDQDPALFREKIPKRQDIVFVKHSDIEPRPSPNHSKHHKGNYTDQKSKLQKVLGNKGELLIYNMLVDKYGEDSVKFRSEAAVELGLRKPGLTESGEYDISYCIRDGEELEEFYVEVKTGNSNRFYISTGELAFAKKHPDKFKLFVVYNLDQEEPCYRELPKEFWNDENYHCKEVVEKIEVQF